MSGLFQRSAFGIFNGLAPMLNDEAAPKTLPYRFDFSSVSEIKDDLLTENIVGEIQFVQSIYINNRDNDAEFRIKFLVTNQEVVCPANAIITAPVIATNQVQFVARMQASANRVVDVQFLNIPMPFNSWGPISVDVANVTATFTPTVGTYANSSGNTTANTSTVLFAANANAIRRVVQNPTSNIESLWIEFGGAATAGSPSVEIAPGQTYDTTTGPIDQTEWQIISVNAIPYTAKEMV